MPDDELDDKGTEGAADDKGGDKEEEFSEDDLSTIIDIEDFDLDEEEGGKGGKKDDKGKDEGDKGKGDDKGKGQQEPDFKSERDDLLRKNKDLNKALHEARQKKGGDEEASLTDDQIKGILEEYKDDPSTLINVIKYIAKSTAKGEADKSIDSVQIKHKQKVTEEFIHKTYPSLLEDGSQIRTTVDKMKDEYLLKDHPLGEYLATSVTIMGALPSILKSAYDKGIADFQAGKAEKSRQQLNKELDLTPKGKKGGEKIESTPAIQDVASRLGLSSPKQIALLKKLTASGKAARTVSVEE